MLIRDFASIAAALPLADFLERFTHPFLIQLNRENSESGEAVGFGTISGNMQRLLIEAETTDCKVYFIIKRDNNAFSMMVTVGRAENNDIIVRFGKVSKFHGYFSQIGADWFLTDSNSSNGTFLGSQRLEASKSTLVPDRSELSFSREMGFQFLMPASMHAHLQSITGR